MKTEHKCENCGGDIDAFKFNVAFCSRCGCKMETYFIEDNDRRRAEMSSASAALSFVGILSGFIFAIFLMLMKPQLVGFIKIFTYFTLISSICILLFLCFFLLHTVKNLKNGYINDLGWFGYVLHVLYVPFALMLITLLIISWKAHWGYSVLCLIALVSMFAFIRLKLGYEESIFKFMSRISKQDKVDDYHIDLAKRWIDFLTTNELISTKESSGLTEQLERIKRKSSTKDIMKS
jgi:hypothetical protein